jgi:serine/threonine-protein kinase TTK/MPS1
VSRHDFVTPGLSARTLGYSGSSTTKRLGGLSRFGGPARRVIAPAEIEENVEDLEPEGQADVMFAPPPQHTPPYATSQQRSHLEYPDILSERDVDRRESAYRGLTRARSPDLEARPFRPFQPPEEQGSHYPDPVLTHRSRLESSADRPSQPHHPTYTQPRTASPPTHRPPNPQTGPSLQSTRPPPAPAYPIAHQTDLSHFDTAPQATTLPAQPTTATLPAQTTTATAKRSFIVSHR